MRIDRVGGSILLAGGCIAMATALTDRDVVEGTVASVAYFLLPIVAALAGLGCAVLARRSDVTGRRMLLLAVSLAALAGWTLVLFTRTAINGVPV